MIRLILVASFVIGFLLFFSGVLYRLKKLGQTDWETAEWKSLNIVRRAFFRDSQDSGSKGDCEGSGTHSKPTRRRFNVGNHRSYFDIVMGYITVPGLTGFIAKKEMAKIPLLNRWMDR